MATSGTTRARATTTDGIKGPVFDSTNPQQRWGDIIPPIPGVHQGQNWNGAGQEILENGCSLFGDVIG